MTVHLVDGARLRAQGCVGRTLVNPGGPTRPSMTWIADDLRQRDLEGVLLHEAGHVALGAQASEDDCDEFRDAYRSIRTDEAWSALEARAEAAELFSPVSMWRSRTGQR